jgi:hypothetical protein
MIRWLAAMPAGAAGPPSLSAYLTLPHGGPGFFLSTGGVQNGKVCSRYRSSDMAVVAQYFMAYLLESIGVLKPDAFPSYDAPFIRRPPELISRDEAVLAREAVIGRFALLQHWAKDEKPCKSTYNTRSETVASKPGVPRCLAQGPALHHSGCCVL